MGKGKRSAAAEELDLVPIMNLVTILIPFLLMAAQFVSYAVIDSTLPAIGPPQPIEDKEDEDPPLNLSVFITDKGYTVAGSAAVLKGEGGGEEGEEKGPTIECMTPGCVYAEDSKEGASEAYDVVKLRTLLTEIKDEYPDEQNVILVPEPDIPYEVLVVTMDATRENPDAAADEGSEGQCTGRCLFPFVVIAGGVETK
jgi:biopolymer transport protein ExbD